MPPPKSRGSGADPSPSTPPRATGSAYVEALKLLARRELSQAQVRIRLTRRGYGPGSVDDAIARLTAERAIDDGRLAEAIARAEVDRRHGRRKVLQRMENAGLERSLARQTVARVFAALDEDALVDAALERRLRDGASIVDDAELRRLYRFLVGQGFDGDLAMRALKARSVK